MTELSTMAPHVINSYAWAVLKANTSMTESDYGGRVPIIPSNQEPEFTQYNKPFIVYGFAEDPSNINLAQRSGTLVYAIYADTASTINKIYNILTEALGRFDKTAYDVNAWISKSANYANFAGISMRYVAVAFGEGPGPVEQEGGRQVATLTIKYSHVSTYTVITGYNADYSSFVL